MNNRKCTLAKRWLFLHDFSSWLNVCFPPKGHLHAGIVTIVVSLGDCSLQGCPHLKITLVLTSHIANAICRHVPCSDACTHGSQHEHEHEQI